MKHSAKVQIKRIKKEDVKQSIVSLPVQSKTSTTPRKGVKKVTHLTKRYSKQALRAVLLSKVFHKMCNATLLITLVGGISFGVYSYFTKTFGDDVIVSKSEIVERVARLTEVPTSVPDAVVRVEDPETLKKQNDFYQNVKSGDYIVMYPKVAVIYDLRNNSIVGIKKSEDR